MVEERSSGRETLLGRLGGQPGPYAVACVVLALLWFPFRLLFDSGDPLAEIVVVSGMQGASWALIPLGIEWGQRHSRRLAPDLVERPAGYAHRGAIVALAAGVPFSGALLILALGTGQAWGYAVFFGCLLVVIVAVAVKKLWAGHRVTALGRAGERD